MKKYRRIEITVFRRRVTIVSAEPAADKTDEDVSINDSGTQEIIATDSAEGQRILAEAVRLLEVKLSGQTPEGRLKPG